MQRQSRRVFAYILQLRQVPWRFGALQTRQHSSSSRFRVAERVETFAVQLGIPAAPLFFAAVASGLVPRANPNEFTKFFVPFNIYSFRLRIYTPFVNTTCCFLVPRHGDSVAAAWSCSRYGASKCISGRCVYCVQKKTGSSISARRHLKGATSSPALNLVASLQQHVSLSSRESERCNDGGTHIFCRNFRDQPLGS